MFASRLFGYKRAQVKQYVSTQTESAAALESRIAELEATLRQSQEVNATLEHRLASFESMEITAQDRLREAEKKAATITENGRKELERLQNEARTLQRQLLQVRRETIQLLDRTAADLKLGLPEHQADLAQGSGSRVSVPDVAG